MAKKSNIYILFVIFISLSLSAVWFHQKMILAKAEEGIIFYDPIRTFNLYKSLWLDIGFGSSAPFYIPRLPFFAFNQFLYLVGFPNWMIQQTIFSLVIITPLLFLPKVVSEFFPKKPPYIGYIAAGFYTFNLFTLSQVWQRFIYPLMFLWSFLPLFIFLWLRLIRTQKKNYLFFLIISTIIFGDAFGLTSSFLTLSFAALCCLAFSLYSFKFNTKKILFVFVSFVIWVAFQLWWIVPIYQLRNDRYASFLDSNNAIKSLEEVSKFFPSSDILLLKQSYFFSDSNFLGYFYNKPAVFYYGIFIAILVLVGILFTIRDKSGRFLFVFFLVGWFVSKGFNPPFGKEFYSFIFSYFPFTQILRNPYEKFGVIFLLPYSVFFSLGLFQTTQWLKKFYWVGLLCIAFFTFCMYVWPIWTGDVFTGARISVPQYYIEANRYLNYYDDRRILILPLLQESSIEYFWRYKGEDPSEFLFDRPSLARSDFGIPTDEFYINMSKYITNKNFAKILSVAAVSNIVLRKDTFQNTYNQSSIYDYLSHAQQWKDVMKGKDIGDLTVFSVKKDSVNNWTYAVDTLHDVASLSAGMDMIVADSFNPKREAIIVTTAQNKLTVKEPLKIPNLSFVKKSSTNYSVSIKEAADPFVLILAVSYNPFWKASSGDIIFTKHAKVNGYANGWVIDKKGTYDIDLKFTP